MIPPPTGPAPILDRPVVPEWAITFADMMSLLLTFFIVVASYSYTDASRYRALAGSMRAAFGTGDLAAGPLDVTSNEGSPDATYAQVERELLDLIDLNQPEGGCELVRSPEGMRLRVSAGVMFDLGRAELRPEARPFLEDLAPVLAQYPGRIWVEGHTDDLPIQNALYPSNWELSAGRAAAVVRSLIKAGRVSPQRIAAVGYAETRPLVPNSDAASRSRNRRVEIFLQRDRRSSRGSDTP
jgi:chemotaxis protein MotB